MKTKEFMNGIAGMSMAELNDELVAAKKELFNLRFQNATNPVSYTHLDVYKRQVTFYPDFTDMNSRTGRIYYLEHFGMMDNEDYYNAVLRKLDAFEMNQLLIGRDVLLLHESSSAPLNTRVLDCYIQEYLV